MEGEHLIDKKFHEKPRNVQLNVSRIYGEPKYLKRALNIHDSLWASTYRGSYEILDFLNDISMAIEKCKFKEGIQKPLALWKQGYTEKQIAELLNITQQSVHSALSTACIKLSMVLKK